MNMTIIVLLLIAIIGGWRRLREGDKEQLWG